MPTPNKLFTKEAIAKFERERKRGYTEKADATRQQSSQMKQKVEQQAKQGTKRLTQQRANRAYNEIESRRKRRDAGITVNNQPVSQRSSDAYAATHGEIKDGNQAQLDKAMAQWGLHSGLGQMTNISDQWRATPSFANFVGRSTPEAMAMAGSLVANPVGTILGMGTGHLGSQAGGYVGEQLGNREAGEITGSLVGMPFGFKIGNTLQRTVPNYYRNYTRVKGNHYQEVKPQYEIVYNETTGDFERVPIEKIVNTEGLYNHPGAFLGNTATGGITVNGQRVLRKPYITPQTVNEGTVASGLVNDQPLVAAGRNITVNGEVINNALPEELAQRGWEARRPITINGKETLQVWHPQYGYTTLEEATGKVGRGTYANLVTNEALDAYNPAIRADVSNGSFLDQLRSIARKVDMKKETPADIKNTSEYEYPRIWDLILKTSLGKQEYPNGATMVSRGLWPGSSTTAKSPNYDALFTGYNRDMAMPYIRIGQNLGGKNNFGLPQYEKYFPKEKVELLRDIDRQIEELITTKGYYNQEDSGLLQHLHNLRSTLLGDKLPEFGGLQQLLVPNKANGEMLNTVMPRGLAMEHSTFGDLGAGNPIYIPKLAGDTGFYDANAVSGALASEGPAHNIYGIWLHSISPEFTGIHDKGVGSTLIWNQDGFAPFLKSVHGNSFKNLSGSIESAYRKGGKFLKNTK